jgi:hypothetical protein
MWVDLLAADYGNNLIGNNIRGHIRSVIIPHSIIRILLSEIKTVRPPNFRCIACIPKRKSSANNEHLRSIDYVTGQGIVGIAGSGRRWKPFYPGKRWQTEDIDIIEAGCVWGHSSTAIEIATDY